MAADLSMVQQKFKRLHAKRQFLSLSIFLFSFFFSLMSIAAQSRYHFTIPAEEKRYQELLLDIRCMVCENQSLAESNAPLAEDLRLEVYQQIIAGKSDPRDQSIFGGTLWRCRIIRTAGTTKYLTIMGDAFNVITNRHRRLVLACTTQSIRNKQ